MIWLILIAALGLRLIGINQSLWLDEAISANVAKMPINQILSNFSINDFHPPVFYWFLNLWVNFFGSSVMMMRLSSVLFSLITIFGVYKIGKKIKNKQVGLWAAGLTAVNPLMIYYSQELRMYAMAVMWLTWAIYFWVKIVKKDDSKRNWIWFNLFVFLAFTTFYGSAFLIGAMVLYFLFNKEWKNLAKSVLGAILAVLIVSPLLWQQLKISGQMLATVTNWSLVLGKVNLKNSLLIPLKFCIGRISWYPKISYYIISGVWTIVVFGVAIKNSRKEKILIWLMIVPLILGILFSFKSPMIQYFRFLYLIPILSLFLASEKNKILKIILAAGMVAFSLMYLLNPKMYREDWKEIVASLGNGEKVYMIGSFGDPVKFYNPTILIKNITKINPTENKIVLIPYGEMIHGINTKEKLEKLGYKLVEQNVFREITLEKWQK